MRIGIDFDNTIVSYDTLMHQWALERGLISESVLMTKKSIRDAIRGLDDGESKWRSLQVFCYGPGIPYAQPMPDVKEFLAACKIRSIPVWIVSHKTEDANFGEPNVKLREAALRWLEAEGFLDSAAFGIGREHIFFEGTRQAKVERIRMLGLTHFIDDLEETFLEESFPPYVVKLLLSPQPSGNSDGQWQSFGSWSDIQRELVYS